MDLGMQLDTMQKENGGTGKACKSQKNGGTCFTNNRSQQ